MRFVISLFRRPNRLTELALKRIDHCCTSRRSVQTSSKMAAVSPFTKVVVASTRHLYPEVLADKSFDNTGLLLEAPIPSHLPRKANSVLLTIDLTKAVADEAIEGNYSVIIAYHPIIFRGLKSITLDNSQQQSLLRLASHGVSVYCPHTAVDIVPDGMADWLCDIVAGKIEPKPEPRAFTAESEADSPGNSIQQQQSEPASEVDITTSEEEDNSDQPSTPSETRINGSADPFVDTPKPKSKRPTTVHRTYSKPAYPSRKRDQEPLSPQRDIHRPPSPIQSSPTTTFYHSAIPHKRAVISPSPTSALDAANSSHSPETQPPAQQHHHYTSTNTGAGRLLTFTDPQPLHTLITRIAHATGTPKGFPVAIPQSRSLESLAIRTVGICPGSGASVISRCVSPAPPDLVFTGEMSHHDALAVIERGGCVICLFHSNSERGYLDSVMRGRIEEEVRRRWAEARQRNSEDEDEAQREILRDDEDVSVVVSERDRDPFGIVVLQESRVEGEMIE